MDIKECKEIIKYISIMSGDCPEERLDGLEHECKADDCMTCWSIRLGEYIKILKGIE